MSQPKFLAIDPHKLRKNPWNTNIVTPENDLKLEESIRRNGMFKPILVREVDGELEIIGGEHRWDVAIRMKLANVPIVNLGPITIARAKEISVLDNARYGDDDILAFSELLKEIGTTDVLQNFLPYGESDLTSIFSSSSIALDDLEIDENFNVPDNPDLNEPIIAKQPKTHTVMRFKVSLNDAEKITALIAQTQKGHGYTTSDDLTNAGDALVHLLKGPAD